jgi:8-oxo-dGTP pyrophosphatase MutT (NUDIX family)
MHHIHHYILTKLSTTKWAKFSDLRPPKIDSNAYSYHLKLLQKQQLIEKHQEKGYRLSPKGLTQVDRMSTYELHFRLQPKIITMCVLYDDKGRVLLLAKSKQPFIGAWTFASGKLHIEDGSVRNAMVRELSERVALPGNESLRHAADVYINASIDGELVSTVLAHVFTMLITPEEIARQDVLWVQGGEWQHLQLAPGVEEVYAFIKGRKNDFSFAEFSIDW